MLLPATGGPRGDGNPPSPLRSDRHASLWVVHQRRAPVQAPPLHEVPGMATANEEAMEGHRGGVGVEEATSPVGQISVGGEGYGCGVRVPAYHEGGMQRPRESAPRGQGGGERRGGGPRPALECTFPWSFPSGGYVEATSSFFCLSLLLAVWEAHYDRLDRSRRKGLWYIETATAVASEPLPWPFGPHVAG